MDRIWIESLELLEARQRRAVELRFLERNSLRDMSRSLKATPAETAQLLVEGLLALELISSGDAGTLGGETVVFNGESGDRLYDQLARLLISSDEGKVVDWNELVNEFPDSSTRLHRFLAMAERFAPAEIGEGDTLAPQAPAVHQMATLDGDAAHQFSGQLSSASGAGELPQRGLFGDYELIKKIAQGGMGVVYKARQRKLNRIVALKMILSGQFANQLEVERFYVEAAAAANLRHPNIVAVYEVGEVEGRHFFSMDFVEGESLAELVREHPLPPEEAAKMVRKIAGAVQFAHDHDILHRDLKPSNVLLDKAGEPLITDFGLAKRVGDKSQLTITGAVVGTPAYMPPEQASGDEVGKTSDVYSLGAILYELITGAPPFRAANAYETIRQVLEVEPASPRLLNASTPKDLETICLKCLQKEASRRYRSAQELAEELKRFQQGRPILARPVSRPERIWRWCRRNPGTAGLISTVVTTLVLALVVSVQANIRTAAALRRAKESRQRTLRAVDKLYVKVSEDRLLNKPGFQSLRKELLMEARDLYREILAQVENDPAVRDELALSHYRLGTIMQFTDSSPDALQAFSTARRMQQELVEEYPRDEKLRAALADTINAMGKSLQEDERLQEAQKAFEESSELRRRLSREHPDDLRYTRKLANSLQNLAIVAMEKADRTQVKAQRASLYRQAEGLFTQAQEARQKQLAKISSGNPHHRQLLRDFAKGFFNKGNLALRRLSGQNQMGQAVMHFERAIDQFEKLARRRAESLEDQFLRALCYRRLGDLYQASRQKEKALSYYDKAAFQLKSLSEANQDVHTYAAAWASVLLNKGVASEGQFEQTAEEAYAKAVEILRELAKEELPSYRYDLGNAHIGLALSQWRLSKLTDVRGHLDRAKEILASLVQEYPSNQKYARNLQKTKEYLKQLGGGQKETKKNL